MSIRPFAKISWNGNVPISHEFDDPYYSLKSGEQESEYVFLAHNNLPNKFFEKNFIIGETGFGTGLNFLVTADSWIKNRKTGSHLTYFSIEKYPIQKNQLIQLYQNWPQYKSITDVLIKQYPENIPGYHPIKFIQGDITLVLMIGDVCEMLDQLIAKVDAWYLDGFAPSKNQEMWSLDVFNRVVNASHIGTTFATFTAAGFVRRNLKKAGFDVRKVKGFGQKREMLCGEITEAKSRQSTRPWFTINKENTISSSIAIIGGGVAGLSCALTLAEQGIESTIIDAGESYATGASGNPAGIVLPKISLNFDLVAQFNVSSFNGATQFYCDLKQEFKQLQWINNGVIQIETEERIEKFLKLSLPTSLMSIIDQNELSRLAGIHGEKSALYFPRAGTINPLQLCEIMSIAAGDKLKAIFSTKVDILEKSNGEWLLKSKENKVICRAEKVIIANSFDATRLLNAPFLTLAANRGQLSYLPASEQSEKLRTAICGDAYMIPAENKLHVIGATYGGVTKTVNKQDHYKNWSAAESLIPGCLNDVATIKSGRVSFRGTSKDHLPIVGSLIDEFFYREAYSDLHYGRAEANYPTAQYINGLYLSVGHGSRGLVTSITAARYLASLVSGTANVESSNTIELLHSGRFMIRDFKKNKSAVDI